MNERSAGFISYFLRFVIHFFWRWKDDTSKKMLNNELWFLVFEPVMRFLPRED